MKTTTNSASHQNLQKTLNLYKLFATLVLGLSINGKVHCDPLTPPLYGATKKIVTFQNLGLVQYDKVRELTLVKIYF